MPFDLTLSKITESGLAWFILWSCSSADRTERSWILGDLFCSGGMDNSHSVVAGHCAWHMGSTGRISRHIRSVIGSPSTASESCSREQSKG